MLIYVVMLLSFFIFIASMAIYSNQQAERRIDKFMNETREINAAALTVSIAATLAAPHLNGTHGRDESAAMVEMMIPIARKIVMNYKHE